jgi:clathrin heavy chain
LIDCTNRSGLFKEQAKYLVERKFFFYFFIFLFYRDLGLWEKVLSNDNPNRKFLIEQVNTFALPHAKDADDVSVTVKVFFFFF